MGKVVSLLCNIKQILPWINYVYFTQKPSLNITIHTNNYCNLIVYFVLFYYERKFNPIQYENKNINP